MRKKFLRCKKCLMTSLRPRISFNKSGICNACQNFEIYRKIRWKDRFEKLKLISKKINNETKNQKYNCIVPVGGGKDSSYVAWKVKHDLKLKPLCVFCEPPLFTKVGKINLDNFRKSGFDIKTLKFKSDFKKYDKLMFKNKGLPQHSWLTAITIFPIKLALKYNCKYIIGGEDPESLYGGTNKNFLRDKIKVKNYINNFIENNHVSSFYRGKQLKKFKNLFLNKNELKNINKVYKIFWSNFEYWDEDKHFSIAINKCGLVKAKKSHSNALNKVSHIDQELYPLHMYLAYLKFGFSRASTDTSIDIRHRKISRREAVKIVNNKDFIFPNEFLKKYLNYFDLTKKEFFNILSKQINKDIFSNNDFLNLKLKKFG